MAATNPNEWGAFALEEVQFISLRARGKDAAGTLRQIVYDRGTVLVTENVDSASPTTRVLGLVETRALLAALRAQARVTPRPKQVDSGALHAFIAALARVVNSPGAIPFASSSFGSISQTSSGIVGQVLVDEASSLSVVDDKGVISTLTSKRGVTGGFRRQLTIAQLRALIGALRARTAAATPLDALWTTVLEDAVQCERAIAQALAAARDAGREPRRHEG